MEIRKDILMKDIEIRELFRSREEYAGKEIVVRGWVRGNRASNQFGFISLNDGTFFTPLQVVYEASKIDISSLITSLQITFRSPEKVFSFHPCKLARVNVDVVFSAVKTAEEIPAKITILIQILPYIGVFMPHLILFKDLVCDAHLL